MSVEEGTRLASYQALRSLSDPVVDAVGGLGAVVLALLVPVHTWGLCSPSPLEGASVHLDEAKRDSAFCLTIRGLTGPWARASQRARAGRCFPVEVEQASWREKLKGRRAGRGQ